MDFSLILCLGIKSIVILFCPDLLKMIKDKVDESFGKSRKKFGCDYVNEGFMGFDIGHDDFICGDLKCECGRPKPLFHSVRPHKVHLTDKVSTQSIE